MNGLNEIWKSIVEKGDYTSYRIFFDHFYPRLFHYSIEYVKVPSAAEEVVSDVIYNLLKDKARLKKIERIQPYIFVAVKNRSLKWLRDHKKFRLHDQIEEIKDYIIDDENLLSDSNDGVNIAKVFENVLQKLPRQRQLVFRLIRMDGLLVEEVAELLNISPRTIERHMELVVEELCVYFKDYIKDQRHHAKIRKIFPRRFLCLF